MSTIWHNVVVWILKVIVWSGNIRLGSTNYAPTINVNRCPHSPISSTSRSRFNIEVPSYPFEMNLTITLSHQNFFYCSESERVKEIAYFLEPLNELENVEIEFGNVYMTPQGVLAVDHSMYQKDEFCLYNYSVGHNNSSQPELIFKICLNNCNLQIQSPVKNEPCVKKCCPIGMVIDFTFGYPDCMPQKLSPERDVWKATFYDSVTWKRMSFQEQNNMRPHYLHNILNSNCSEFEHFYGKVANYMNMTHPKQSVRLLSDGNIIYISGKRRWEILKGVDFCLDGMQNFDEDGSQDGIDFESDQVLMFCATDFNNKSRAKSILYMYFFFGAAFFYCMTAMVHGLLWEKQNSNGWSMFCLTLCMGVWSILMGNAHRLGLDGDPALREGVVCMINGILAHFFMLAGFTWLTLINYSIWSTFRTFKIINKTKNLTQFLKFLLIGFGCPLIVILVGITLEQIYPDPESLIIIPEYGRNTCLVALHAQGVYIYYILGILFLIIMILSGLTCFKLHQIQQETAKVRFYSTAGERSMAQLYAKLSVVLGITWAFEFISWAFTQDEQSWFWVAPDLYNLLTSAIIFVIYACKPSTIQQMEEKYPCVKCMTQTVRKVIMGTRDITSESHTAGSTTFYQQNSSSIGNNARVSEMQMSSANVKG